PPRARPPAPGRTGAGGQPRHVRRPGALRVRGAGALAVPADHADAGDLPPALPRSARAAGHHRTGHFAIPFSSRDQPMISTVVSSTSPRATAAAISAEQHRLGSPFGTEPSTAAMAASSSTDVSPSV